MKYFAQPIEIGIVIFINYEGDNVFYTFIRAIVVMLVVSISIEVFCPQIFSYLPIICHVKAHFSKQVTLDNKMTN